jgi:tRNA(Ile)-lysidine synthase TilS/MesJ
MIDVQQKLQDPPVYPDLPKSIFSLHVDHSLQSDAAKMAHAARASATRFKAIHHVELRIPWGEPPFPPRPGAAAGAGAGEEALETAARTARYRMMFDAMVRHRLHVLATGHHADDQIETVLMRLGAGSSILGLGGMRPARRFGMALGKFENGGGGGGAGGVESDFGWFGHEGLDRWIVRPLLEVSKVGVCFFILFAWVND